MYNNLIKVLRMLYDATIAMQCYIIVVLLIMLLSYLKIV
jgi:hypothetical protein